MIYRKATFLALSMMTAGTFWDGAVAQETVTVVSFGGSYQDAERKAMYEPTAKKLGVRILEDSLRGIADVRLQVQSGKTRWDVVELGRQYCMADDAAQLFEPLDFNVIKNAAEFRPDMKGERWVGGPVYYSYVLAWNPKVYGDNPPRTWADFFDTKRFPGQRALYAQPRFMLELALLGDGVKPADLYPLDVERALNKIRAAKPHIVSFYTAHGQSVQLIKDGEVDLLVMTDGRAAAAIVDGANVKFTYNEGIIDAGCLAILRGAPNKARAMHVINEFIDPEIQANIPHAFNYGPVNPKAFQTGKISPELAASLNSSPENIAKQVTLGSRWWADNEARVQPLWDAMLQQ
jgi:putative spermidine/putrescine transport system substrate-binding protein